MRNISEFKRGAFWLIKEIRKVMPFGMRRNCDCGADLLYHIDKIVSKIKRMK